jgi:hypothetical protein
MQVPKSSHIGISCSKLPPATPILQSIAETSEAKPANKWTTDPGGMSQKPEVQSSEEAQTYLDHREQR